MVSARQVRTSPSRKHERPHGFSGQGTQVEVNRGVNEGDQVILNPPLDLVDGGKVQPRTEAIAAKRSSCGSNYSARPNEVLSVSPFVALGSLPYLAIIKIAANRALMPLRSWARKANGDFP
jgi:hypothetical protein